MTVASESEFTGVGTSIGTPTEPSTAIEVGLLTGGFDRHYATDLAMTLAERGVRLDVIGSDDVDSPEMHATANLSFLNLQGSRTAEVSFARKIWRLALYYAKLLHYAATARPRIFHILWNAKFQFFDRTLLMLYYKLLGKKVTLTAHNVNAGKRDSNDSLLNRLTLKVQYRLADHIFVHTQQMKGEILRDFGVQEGAVTVIRHPVNNFVPDTALSSSEARKQLGVREGEKTILFFGAIRPYKGLEYLVTAFQRIMARQSGYRLIIAGEPKKDADKYLGEMLEKVSYEHEHGHVIRRLEFIPDSETELYFKAADVLVLPYTHIFQSGVLFLAYSFGLPVVATDVGSLREDIIEGKTGFLCRPCDPDDLANTIEAYFESDLFKALENRRKEIRHYANEMHSWDMVGERTCRVYSQLLSRRSA